MVVWLSLLLGGYVIACLNVPWIELPVEEIELTLPELSWLMKVGRPGSGPVAR